MKDYNDKILRGSEIRGDQLRLPRAQAIYRAVNKHEYAEIVKCQRNISQDEILTLRLKRLQIPEYPDYPIRTEETVVVICREKDTYWPEVYAIRDDFPIGLPHSNAMPYKRPVSMCVSEYHFYDVRLQFNAYDFINSIRHWFEKNSIGELHESDRPIEIFMIPDGFYTLMGERENYNPYIKIEQITTISSVIRYSNAKDATHTYMFIKAKPSIATSMVYRPKTIGDLSDLIELTTQESIITFLISRCASVPKRVRQLPILLFVRIEQKRAIVDDKSIEYFAIDTGVTGENIFSRVLKSSQQDVQDWLRIQSVKILDCSYSIHRLLNILQNSTSVSVANLTIIGTGTLGSNVIDHIVRKGVCERLTIIDNDVYYPHNFGRHVLPAQYVMHMKSVAMQKLYADVLGQKIIPVPQNACLLPESEQSQFYGAADLIIDASTVIAVERYLARDVSVKKGRCCSIFLNPQGTDLVLLMEDKARKTRLDFLEMAYYSAILDNDSLQNHLEVPEQQRTSTFSCRSESNIIDYDDVGVLASIASREIQRYYQDAEAKAEIWRINKPEGNVTRVEIPIPEWELYENDGVKVYVSKRLQDTLNKERIAWGEYETGGCLCGCYDRDRRIIYVFAQIPAPPDSKRTKTSFERGIEGLNETKQEIAKRSYFQVRYIGEWHSHPHSDSRPSTLDREQFAQINDELLQEDVPFVQMICGVRDFYVKCRM